MMIRQLLPQLRMLLPVVSCLLLSTVSLAQNLDYPQTRKDNQVDDYFGTKVADPYRWLEDDNSAETGQWVAAENKVTFGYLNKIPYRADVKKRLEELYNYPKYTAPFSRGEYLFFFKNDGLQNQDVLYVQKGLESAPEILLDPNKFSADGTSRLGTLDVSSNGRYAAYGISVGGSDWQEIHVMEVATKKPLADDLKWIKFVGAGWAGNGFFYSRYDTPQPGHELSSKNENQKVYYHVLGAPQSEDRLVYQDPQHPLRFLAMGTTDDEHYAVLSISDEASGKRGNALFFRGLSAKDDSLKPIVPDVGDDQYDVIDNVGDKFLILTNHGAPNRKVVLFDPDHPVAPWTDVIPEKSDTLQGVTSVGGKLFARYLQDVASRVDIYSLAGTFENQLALPGAGAAEGFLGNRTDKDAFYTYTSFNYPPTVFRYVLATQKSTVYHAPEIPGFRPEDYETKEIFYHSKDGTRVPMFLVCKKGLKLDGTNPTLLYAYGGFNITISPAFSPLRLALLEQGFVYASANIRGGGEYGEKWHEAGTKLHKQNVFDDFIAAAEWLIANKYTSPQKLAITGASNGGLLIGAVMNQRPDLFRVAVPMVGVMDMLRFQKFTIGSSWIDDYGSSDNPEQFKALYAYSPLHNIKPGVKYPATLITTADHDDRVVPAHSFKYAATLQAEASRANPVLIRIETKSGHHTSSTAKTIELAADADSFIFYNLGVTPKY
ncbi:MAG TPA: prolyl oligopeptidase family serine peptidase [Candidatus Eisenbacteria bacterium]|nr:prolyl oligopeptidase family serine peptidase [Candidatus Eisenbacteria bacterium]